MCCGCLSIGYHGFVAVQHNRGRRACEGLLQLGDRKMSSTTEDTVELPSVERTLAGLKKHVQAAVATQTQAAEQATRIGNEVSAQSQATMDAFTQAAQIFARGSQDLFRQTTENSWSVFQDGVSSLRAIATAPNAKQPDRAAGEPRPHRDPARGFGL
jgi:hypothetical protein